MDIAVLLMSLVINIYIVDPVTERLQVSSELYPVTVSVCETIDGRRTEDSSCGIKQCMAVGRARAAVIWGKHPGANFDITCFNDNGEAASKESTGGGGGHPALGFE